MNSIFKEEKVTIDVSPNYTFYDITDKSTDVPVEFLRAMNVNNNIPIMFALPDFSPAGKYFNGFVVKTKHIFPGILGFDISDGMQVSKVVGMNVELIEHMAHDIDILKKYVPIRGHEREDEFNVPKTAIDLIGNLKFIKAMSIQDRSKAKFMFIRQFGTIGRGSHFVELALGSNSSPYVITHCGVRGLSKLFSIYYSALADKTTSFNDGKKYEIEIICDGKVREDFLSDMSILLEIAKIWRKHVSEKFLDYLTNEIMNIVSIEDIYCYISKDYMDFPHNFVEEKDDSVLHYKGALKMQKEESSLGTSYVGFTASPASSYLYRVLADSVDPKMNLFAPHGVGRRWKTGDYRRDISDSLDLASVAADTYEKDSTPISEDLVTYREIGKFIETLKPIELLKLEPVFCVK